MKLIRYTENSHIKTGVVINNKNYDTSSFGEDYNEAFFNTFGMWIFSNMASIRVKTP